MRPATFDADRSEAWSAWVLDHGLPELPGSNLAVGQSVPVSFWAGPTAGAVIHVRRVFDERHEAPVIETEIDQLLRVEGRWRPEMSSGGSWPDDPPLARIQVPPTFVALDGSGGSEYLGQGTKALWGRLGTDAAVAKVHQAGQVVRRPVEAPVGLFVVCADVSDAFTLRVLGVDGRVLAEIQEPAGRGGSPPPSTVRSLASLRQRLFGVPPGAHSWCP